VDITIEVMLPARGGSWSDDGHNHYPMLGVVGVYDHMKVTDTVGMPRTGYVHVTGLPDEKFETIRARLEESNEGADEKIWKRRWAGVVSRIPFMALNRLMTDRQITVTWTQFRGFLQNIREQRDFADADMNIVEKL
jgi:hypothetical protein